MKGFILKDGVKNHAYNIMNTHYDSVVVAKYFIEHKIAKYGAVECMEIINERLDLDDNGYLIRYPVLITNE